MKTVGFCLVTNVKGHDENNLLKAVKAFGNLPLKTKTKMALKHHVPENPNIYTGYHPFIDNNISHKELYDMQKPLEGIPEWERKGCALYHENPWVKGEEEWIKDAFENQFKVMDGLG